MFKKVCQMSKTRRGEPNRPPAPSHAGNPFRCPAEGTVTRLRQRRFDELLVIIFTSVISDAFLWRGY